MNAATRTDDRPITVGDLMAAEPIVVRADASLTEAAQVMDEYDVSGLPVVAEGGVPGGLIEDLPFGNLFSNE